jgi:hypothetical protein
MRGSEDTKFVVKFVVAELFVAVELLASVGVNVRERGAGHATSELFVRSPRMCEGLCNR